MNNRFLRLVKYYMIGLDLFTLNVLVVIAYYTLQRIDERYLQEYTQFWIILNLSWVVVTRIGKLYSEKYILSFETFGRQTKHVYSYWVAVIMLYLFFTQQFGLSRLFIGIVLISQGIMLLLNRFTYLMIRSYLKQRNTLVRRVVIIGYNDTAKKLVSHLEKEDLHTEIVGFCEEVNKVQELTHYPIISPVAGVMEVSQQYNVNEIYSTIAPEQDKSLYSVMQEADQACIHFRLIPDLSFLIKRTVHISYLSNNIPVLSLRQEPLSDADNRIKKRFFDLVVSLTVVVFILSWLIPLVGLLIWLESPGPIIFKQPRTGRDKRKFNCLKFRSMKVNNEAHTMQAIKNDARLTQVGKFLRKTNLDEFPQFINVLKGEMSIVGPRPHMLKHTDDYSKLIEQYMVRQFLKPGITGWAQVNGYRGETKSIEQMKKRVEHDIWYMENWGFWLDIKIILITIFVTLRGDKNAF